MDKYKKDKISLLGYFYLAGGDYVPRFHISSLNILSEFKPSTRIVGLHLLLHYLSENTKLQRKHPEPITITKSVLIKELNLSDKTVKEALNVLIDSELVIHNGKKKYSINMSIYEECIRNFISSTYYSDFNTF